MTLYEMLDMLTAESPKIFLITFVLMSLIQVAPIKINPWDKILTAIGSLFNRDLSSRIDKMENKYWLATKENTGFFTLDCEYLDSGEALVLLGKLINVETK